MAEKKTPAPKSAGKNTARKKQTPAGEKAAPRKNKRTAAAPEENAVRAAVQDTVVPAAPQSAADTVDDAQPEDIAPQAGKKVLSARILWNFWLDGWKKTFTLRGRTSRFELWGWLLPNTVLCVLIQLLCTYILSPHFLRNANQHGFTIKEIEHYIAAAQTIFYFVMVVSLFPLGALLIRRMHDLNRLAWKDYLEPVFTGVVVLSALNFAIALLSNTIYAYTTMLLGICTITIFYGVCYHLLKFLVMTLFYRGNLRHNLYGAPKYKGDEYEEPALNLSCIYFLLIATVGLFWLALALA